MIEMNNSNFESEVSGILRLLWEGKDYRIQNVQMITEWLNFLSEKIFKKKTCKNLKQNLIMKDLIATDVMMGSANAVKKKAL